MGLFRTLSFYLRILAAGVWFFIGTFASLCLLPFRWKDPSMGAVLGRIVYWGGIRILGMRTRVENQQRLYVNQPCIYVVNHQSNLDIITMGCMYPYRTVVIGKKQLRWIPLFGWFYWGAGMVMIDRENRTHSVAGLETAKEAMIKKGHSIWIFAEGTRNRGKSALLPFKKGAFHLAIAAQVPIVPAVHQHLYSYLDVKKRRLHSGQELLMRVLEPIPTTGMTTDDVPRLMDAVRNRMLEALAAPDMKMPKEALEFARSGVNPRAASVRN